MEKLQHLPYLLAAYAAAWIGFAGYLILLVRRQRNLARRVSLMEQDGD
jgi:CcmD family protein